jgi:hypothetical protein
MHLPQRAKTRGVVHDSAKALADGRDMTEIGLMHDIAQRTIAVLGNGASG